jgi:exopolysaccharide production protein ExoZ
VQKLRSIQVLRAIAALGVVIVHTSRGATHLGDAGVDLFFVISGFIMAQVSQGRTRGEFIRARLWRIFPLWFFCLAAFVLTRPIERNFCQDLTSLTLWPVWGMRCEPYLTPGWSLSYELLFYALVALCIRRTSWLFVIIPALFALFLIFPSWPTARFLGWPYLLEFLAGFLIARMPLHHGRYWLALGALLIIIAPIDIHGPWRALTWGAPAAMIVYGALGIEQTFKRKVFDLPVWLGDASYSIYLGHLLFIELRIPFPLLFLVAVAGCCLIYVLVERPLLRRRASIAILAERLGAAFFRKNYATSQTET